MGAIKVIGRFQDDTSIDFRIPVLNRNCHARSMNSQPLLEMQQLTEIGA